MCLGQLDAASRRAVVMRSVFTPSALVNSGFVSVLAQAPEVKRDPVAGTPPGDVATKGGLMAAGWRATFEVPPEGIKVLVAEEAREAW